MSNTYEKFGKYVLLERLATGGMAEVFLARGTGAGGIGKFFAIKRILPQYADSPEFIEMFKAEAKIAINLNHSNIVSIHEFGVEKGQFFLVMDYVEGRNLRQILNKMKKTSLAFSVEQVVYMIKEIAAGLDHAHRTIDGTTGKPLNITHRDMSPQNVMITFEGEAKIVDFGIAKAESQLENTRTGTLKGKFGYMSPEQAEGQPVDLRTDIFSLGIVMWELLANDRLFVANNEINTLRKIRDCQIPSLRKINPNIHSELERIVQKVLARDRNLRYQTGAALHRDLNRFLNRQFPEFSTQDFAVFIKSIFADEILLLRKRTVEYSRLNPDKDTRGDEASVLFDANTESVVITGSGLQTDSQGGMPHDMTGLSNSQSLAVSQINVIQATADSGNTSVVEPTAATGGLIAREEPTENLRNLGSADPTVIAAKKPPGKFLDDSALAKVEKRDLESEREPLETEDQPVQGTRAAARPAETRRPPAPRPEPTTPRWATWVVFGLILFSAYVYLAKSATDTMTPVIAALDPLLHPVHQALGIDLAQRRIANAPSATAAAPVVAANAAPASTAAPTEAAPPDADANIVVTSNPSGGEIFVNDQPTGLSTPNQVAIPGDANFSITVKKRGYRDFKRTELTRASVGRRLDTNLQKLNFGYLDVEIFPPQAATLFVNNREIPLRRAFAHDIPVPGNTPVKVRAQSPNSSAFEEIIVSVPIDHRKSIQINPRRAQRVPTSN